MSPELIQWAIYAGLVIGGWLLRHNGINLPGLPSVPTPPIPALSHFPRIKALLDHLGPQGEQLVVNLVQEALQKASGPPPAPPGSQTPGK